MTDYEQAYRDLRAGVEALRDEWVRRYAANEHMTGCPDGAGYYDLLALEVDDMLRALLASSAPATASEGDECPKNAECWQAGGPRQEAQHYRHLYEQASEGKCGHSGLTIRACKSSICDCFEFSWVKASPDEHPDPATASECATEHPDLTRLRERVARAVEHGYTEGDVNHYVQPIIGVMRLRIRDGVPYTVAEMGHAVERLTAACDAETAWLNTPLTATGVTSSDGDRGLSDEEIGTLLCRCGVHICPVHDENADGYVEHRVEDLIDGINCILAARMAQPEGGERVEWGVRYVGTDEVDCWCCESCATLAAGDVDDVMVRRTVTEFAPVVTPWEVVGDE